MTEVVERDFRRHVDRLGNRAVDVFLRHRLHREMIVRRKHLCVDEVLGQRSVLAERRAK